MRIFAERALLPEGWAADVAIEIDRAGTIASVAAGAVREPGSDLPAGDVAPGMANLHSHAFQRAMAGRGERASAANDDFWSWRDAMYALAATLEPDDLYRIARAAYASMLRAGYTAVAEFHYLHRDPRGAWYADRCAPAEALVAAARDAGIAICLLPALYAQGDPRGAPLGPHQARFATSPDDVLGIAAEMRSRHAADAGVVVGVCAHSLRAVSPEAFAALLAGSPADVPVHLHLAEQRREVDEVRAAFGRDPIDLLYDRFDVGDRWCLVHATQATPERARRIAESGAIVGLCPTTEANLGDGIFAFAAYRTSGGAYGIGSDSNVSLAPVEELRLLEYGQRLLHRRRIVARDPRRSCGETLYAEAAAGGARACGLRGGAIVAGMRADLVELPAPDDDRARDADPLDRYVFAALDARPSRTFVAGRER